MPFHQEDRTRYLKSRQRLCNETLVTVAEYFDNLFNSQMADGLLTKKHVKQILFCAKHELRHKLAKCYKDRIHNLANHCYRCKDCSHERSYAYHQNKPKSTYVTTMAITAVTITTRATTNKSTRGSPQVQQQGLQALSPAKEPAHF